MRGPDHANLDDRAPLRAVPRPALRPDRSISSAVVAPPYDVLSDADLDELVARDEHNIVRVDVPREADGAGRYAAAAATLQAWVADGTLVLDPEPSLTLYRMSFTDEAGSPRRPSA